MNFQRLLQHLKSVEENAWAEYLTYRDLRSRGYVVREGFGLGVDFRLYERGGYGKETAKYLILSIQEGKPISLEYLTRVLRQCQRHFLLGAGVIAALSVDTLYISVIAGSNAKASPASTAGRIVLFTVQRLSQINGERHLTHMGRSHEKVSMSKTLNLQTTLEQLYYAGMTDYLPHCLF